MKTNEADRIIVRWGKEIFMKWVKLSTMAESAKVRKPDCEGTIDNVKIMFSGTSWAMTFDSNSKTVPSSLQFGEGLVYIFSQMALSPMFYSKVRVFLVAAVASEEKRIKDDIEKREAEYDVALQGMKEDLAEKVLSE